MSRPIKVSVAGRKDMGSVVIGSALDIVFPT